MKIYRENETNPFFFQNLKQSKTTKVNQPIRNQTELHQVRTGDYVDDKVVDSILSNAPAPAGREVAKESGVTMEVVAPLSEQFKNQLRSSSTMDIDTDVENPDPNFFDYLQI
jgi:hypothetical protein